MEEGKSKTGAKTGVKDWVGSKTLQPPHSATLVDPHMIGVPAVGTEILGGKYLIENVIGVGGMGVVMAALHKQLHQHVAIKFLSATMQTPELVDRFVREGQAAVRIKSEHIAAVLDVGVLETGTPYLMMEHLVGADLSGYLDEHGAIPVEEAVDFILQACDALAVAHAAGIVHRDLKPSNLFVTQRSDGSPLIKVLDFGISKVTQQLGPDPRSTLTRPGMMLGSPRYMSPEQLRNASSVDHRADIWALGIVLHELISGTPPFDADTFTDLCARITMEPPSMIRDAKPEVSIELEAVIVRCLEKDAGHRWQNVAELALALVPFAPEESRVIASRAAKVLGQAANKTTGGTHRSTKASPGNTPKPVDRTQPLTPQSERSPLSSSSSGTAHPAGSAIPSTTPTPSSGGRSESAQALAVSNARPAAVPPRGKGTAVLLAGIAAMGVVGAVAVVYRMRAAPPAEGATHSVEMPASPPPASSIPPPSAASVEEPAPSASPAIAPSSSASAEPVTPPPPWAGGGPHRHPAPPKPAASAAASAPSAAPPSPAPTPKPPEPSEADMLNRRR